ncbi:MAG: endonuclease/exonuclease/phosphatase family protein [Myxococcota bacterium]
MRLRVVTLNLWNEQGPHAARVELCARLFGRLAPDLVALQEVRERPGAVPNQAAVLAERLGMRHVFTPVAEWGGGLEGLALLSRHPIREHASQALPDPESLGPRRVLAATVDTPAGAIAFATTHLAYPLAAGVTREAQVVATDAFARAQPSDGVRFLCGDLNAAPDTDEIRFLRGLTTLAGRRTVWQDAFVRAQEREPGITWSARNVYTAAVAHIDLERRIDYVLVSPRTRDGRAVVSDARVVLDAPDDSGVWPSDHFGVLADVEVGGPRG